MRSRILSGAIASVLMLTSATALAFGRDPTGERADYKVDRNSSRTSSVVQGGDMTAKVTGALPDNGSGPAYAVDVAYTFKIRLIGRQRGSQTIEAPAQYFTLEFMEALRANGAFDGPKFKVKHLGYGDASTMDGRFYPNCDVIEIYDVKKSAGKGAIFEIARDLLAYDGAEAAQIDDLKIKAHIAEGVPVLGAVKLDVSGKYRGQRIKAGADYKTP